jgi:hypothetical protein
VRSFRKGRSMPAIFLSHLPSTYSTTISSLLRYITRASDVERTRQRYTNISRESSKKISWVAFPPHYKSSPSLNQICKCAGCVGCIGCIVLGVNSKKCTFYNLPNNIIVKDKQGIFRGMAKKTYIPFSISHCSRSKKANYEGS